MLRWVVGLQHIPSGSQLVTTMELYSPGLQLICDSAVNGLVIANEAWLKKIHTAFR